MFEYVIDRRSYRATLRQAAKAVAPRNTCGAYQRETRRGEHAVGGSRHASVGAGPNPQPPKIDDGSTVEGCSVQERGPRHGRRVTGFLSAGQPMPGATGRRKHMDFRAVDCLPRCLWSVGRVLFWGALAFGAVNCRGNSRTSLRSGQLAEPGSQTHTPVPVATRNGHSASTAARRSREFEGEQGRVEVSEIPHAPSHRKHAGVERPRSQHVACSELGFVRLLPTGFEGFRYHDFRVYVSP